MARRDAEENRARVIAAAREVFASSGIDAPLDAIARRAGVGRATLYRNFPDRSALVAAIFEDNLAALEALVKGRSDQPDAFMTLLSTIVEQEVEARALIPSIMTGTSVPDLRGLVRRVKRLLTAPLRAAQAAGAVRGDLTITDVIHVLSMIAAVVMQDASPASRRRHARRALELLIDGLAPRS
ncbi:TetR/AcrR family transcriptional regulator [Paraliomyxa miuraensis]|uniref:TetR/AcrR family transcriptional regulator n=1 Tax=Paraliomyxa miuraensis TaxID=376150 RepID=UPI00224D9295|nr:TetR/AcrR family transcriptional regulator [Paraliomyxa miuraensis]MCX4244029.1 TetR/AcrR family transcriptional regulator [Paraliomyxa miuraensis]